ncbi:MAG: GntR family transcriptional regulator [Lentisphaerae bacterium]|nr:MAG: GntR family transcriptional regulator [Lentisphaerota bacterium]
MSSSKSKSGKSSKISIAGKVPLRERIFQTLRDRILSGAYKTKRLPSLYELGKEFDVSVYTVQTAIAKLARQGLIKQIHGSGNYIEDFVSPPEFLDTVACCQYDHPYFERFSVIVTEKLSTLELAPVFFSYKNENLFRRLVFAPVCSHLLCLPPQFSEENFSYAKFDLFKPFVLGFDFWHLKGRYHTLLADVSKGVANFMTNLLYRNEGRPICVWAPRDTEELSLFDRSVYALFIDAFNKLHRQKKIKKFVTYPNDEGPQIKADTGDDFNLLVFPDDSAAQQAIQKLGKKNFASSVSAVLFPLSAVQSSLTLRVDTYRVILPLEKMIDEALPVITADRTEQYNSQLRPRELFPCRGMVQIDPNATIDRKFPINIVKV